MINLKKNDKLIIIIAVAVIVVAAIGIIAYESPDDGNGNTGVTGGVGTYDVIWQTHTNTVSVDGECFAGKSEPYINEIPIDHENILKVTVEISWTDDYTHGIFIKKGEDTLTAEVTCDGKTETWESFKNGTIEFNFNINNIPYSTEIEADNEPDALEKLKEQDYYTDDSLTLTIDVSVQPGEKPRRPLKWLRDQGNAFDLTITYEYYDASLTEGDYKGTGQGNTNDPFDSDEPAYLATIVNIGLTRW